MLKAALQVFVGLICINSVFAIDQVNIKDLKNNLKDPKSALKELYEAQDKWSFFLKQIKDGRADWVELWPQFRKISDAGASEELDLVFSQLIVNNSSLALITIKDAWTRSEATEITEHVCRVTGSEVQDSEGLKPDVEKKTALRIIGRTISSLKKIKSEELNDLKKVCMDSVKKSKLFWEKK